MALFCAGCEHPEVHKQLPARTAEPTPVGLVEQRAMEFDPRRIAPRVMLEIGPVEDAHRPLLAPFVIHAAGLSGRVVGHLLCSHCVKNRFALCGYSGSGTVTAFTPASPGLIGWPQRVHFIRTGDRRLLRRDLPGAHQATPGPSGRRSRATRRSVATPSFLASPRPHRPARPPS